MGLALGYYLQRAGADFLILDDGEAPGGAWRHAWDSLRLFSPAGYSSLPGWLMPPPAHEGYPTRDDVVDYLTRYEARYQLPVRRPVEVLSVTAREPGLELVASAGTFMAARVVSATGTWSKPYIPDIAGRDDFRGLQIHSAHYAGPEPFAGKRVLVVGGGNSGAQIQAELSLVADSTWVTLTEPRFLPDDVDGRVLFQRAVTRLKEGSRNEAPVGGIGDIVMVPPVLQARSRGALRSVRPFESMSQEGVAWPDRTASRIDAVVWCTGFRPALDHLASLGVLEADGRPRVSSSRSVEEPRLWLAGYGDWSGPGSATLMGAARTARDLARQILTA
jgi:putative flavoprotein involved in K+ transport